MLIIIYNLSPLTEVKDIELLIKYSKYNSIFRRTPIKIFVFNKKFVENSELEYFAIVHTDKQQIAKKLILNLNNRYFRGKKIYAKQYFIRSGYNDRRKSYSTEKIDNDLRKKDRRRGIDLKCTCQFKEQCTCKQQTSFILKLL